MQKLTILTLLLIPFFGCSQKSNSTSSNLVSNTPKFGLIFQTGFEPDTKIIKQDSKSAEIVGIDRSLSKLNNWDNDLGAHLNIGYFNIQYQGGEKSQRLAEIATDPQNPSNKVLKFWIKEPNVNPKKGRVQANVYNNNEIRELDYSIRMFLPRDFNAVKSAPFNVKWLTIMEFWNNANWKGEDYQFRISVNLQKPGKGTDNLRIAVKGQTKNTETGKWKKPYLWEFNNSDFVVPIEKWMTIDIHFVEGDAKNGKFKLTITPDGESKTVVHDITNFTHHPEDPNPDGLAHFNPFKLYTSDDLINHVTNSGKLLNIFWDDFKLSIETGSSR
jgi:hypothetical protein